ncbi:hypothetical protein LZ518_00195 [Sphingomonas sp. RB56-2]|uniref:Uncharacterized protein n=1 Tax=Sphingomonas brevis TaxID=2908206 RepID=A0ABT0S5A6_9SPHN|nr:hypothetical protein [Sphingomonas brevis]MCL6739562.1 hypothetical protein [Sphingomonas brevis]
MSARGFGSVLSAGAVVGAALGFYLVSLRVASERAALEEVETRIALTQRDIRLLQTEIGTRGRLAQLERWNVKFIRLSAPNADQFVDGGFQLATLVAPHKTPVMEAPVVLAAAPIPQTGGQPKLTGDADEPGVVAAPPSRPIGEMMHVASYTVLPSKTVKVAPPRPAVSGPATLPAKTSAVTATKSVKTATADPLAPLPGAGAKAKGSAPTAASTKKRTLKDSDD